MSHLKVVDTDAAPEPVAELKTHAGVFRLMSPEDAHKARLLELVDSLRKGVEAGEISTLLVAGYARDADDGEAVMLFRQCTDENLITLLGISTALANFVQREIEGRTVRTDKDNSDD